MRRLTLNEADLENYLWWCLLCWWMASMPTVKRIEIHVWAPTLCPGTLSSVRWVLACVDFLLSLQFMRNVCETEGYCSNTCPRAFITTMPAVAKATIKLTGSVYSISGLDSCKTCSIWKKISKKMWNVDEFENLKWGCCDTLDVAKIVSRQHAARGSTWSKPGFTGLFSLRKVSDNCKDTKLYSAPTHFVIFSCPQFLPGLMY